MKNKNDEIEFDFSDFNSQDLKINKGKPIVKIICVGGGGCNIADYIIKSGALPFPVQEQINHIKENNEFVKKYPDGIIDSNSDLQNIPNIDLIVMNTDAAALKQCIAPIKVQLGPNGQGAGSNMKQGAACAMFSSDIIKHFVKGADVVFILTTLGGGTGSGAAPIIGEIAKQTNRNENGESHTLIINICTTPFLYEGIGREKNTTEAKKSLMKITDINFFISNQRLHELIRDGKKTLKTSFNIINCVITMIIVEFFDIITMNYNPMDREIIINSDFSDIKTILLDRVATGLGIGYGSGVNCFDEAVSRAIFPYLLQNNLNTSSAIFVQIVTNHDMDLDQLELIFNRIKDESLFSDKLIIIYGLIRCLKPNKIFDLGKNIFLHLDPIENTENNILYNNNKEVKQCLITILATSDKQEEVAPSSSTTIVDTKNENNEKKKSMFFKKKEQ